MGSTRRGFTDEYKADAVSLVVEGGRSVAEVARNIGCHEMTLGRWVRKMKEEKEAEVPASEPLPESERAELIRAREKVRALEDENSHLKMQVAFAKKVVAWVAKNPL
jgi:transposase